MNNDVCPKCGKKKEISSRDYFLRQIVSLLSSVFPDLRDICKEAKDYCNDCWKNEVFPIAKNIAEIYGLKIEEEKDE
ncbi:MAG: hypothetical protein ACTSX6_10450 [Candidatus Heimdallarchaeaceae archaeon]